jgi:segregation and condensation protein B
MAVTLCGKESNGKDFAGLIQGIFTMLGRASRPGLARPEPGRLPQNRRLPVVYRLLAEEGHEPVAQGELARDLPLAMVEAALLAADEPLNARRLAAVAGLPDGNEARRQVRRLQALYDRDGTAFQVQELAGGYQLLTRPEYHQWLVRVRRTGNDLRLSPPARETLAIVAYRQPIMRASIESIRGVHCGEILRLLMEKGLIRIMGRDDSLGRPVLYGTTKKFLQVFGLKTLRELPLAEQLRPAQKKAEEDSEPES